MIFTDNGSAFHFYYGEELTQKLGCQKAAAGDINLMPELLKKWGTHNKSENRGTKFECYFQMRKSFTKREGRRGTFEHEKIPYIVSCTKGSVCALRVNIGEKSVEFTCRNR